MGRISPGPTRWPPGAERRLVPAKSNLKPQTTPGAPHNGGKHPPRGRPSATPTASNAGPQGRTRCGAGAGSPRPHRTHPGHPGRGTLAARSRGRMTGGGTAPDTRRPSQWWTTTPRGRSSATPTASNAGPQGRTLWGRCWVHTPASTAPGTRGTRNPGCPLRRTGGQGRDSA